MFYRFMNSQLIGSENRTTIFTNHKQILSLFARKHNINPHFFAISNCSSTICKTSLCRDSRTKFFSAIFAKSELFKQIVTISRKIAETHSEFHGISYTFIQRSFNFHQTYNVFKGEPIETCASNNSYPLHFENGKVKFILQTFDNCHKLTITQKTTFLLRI